ncbi:MAG: biotin carboxylase N-terminal domain-containing protein [Nannocystaceae bacterium]|nr:ATP-grasp domain-containing protein [bacterium]
MPTVDNDQRPASDDLVRAMQQLVQPGRGQVASAQAFATAIGLRYAVIVELRSLPLAELGQRLVALRYVIDNGQVWAKYFGWESKVAAIDETGPDRVRRLLERIEAARENAPTLEAFEATLAEHSLGDIAQLAASVADDSDESLQLYVALSLYPSARASLRTRLREEAGTLFASNPRACDLVYLSCYELDRHPATTVGEGRLDYVLVADKGEMGVRATREAIALGATPVVLHSASDDADALQVRIANEAGGFAIPLEGTFRETYANAEQMVERIQQAYDERFGDDAEAHLQRSALYPGYGPLAENTAAIEYFQRSGIAFIGPMRDVVERAGDKREFRKLAQAIDPKAVTPGIIIDDTDAEEIASKVIEAHNAGAFTFPGRLKAANGGGGRGQVVLEQPSEIPSAVLRVLGEITSNGWDPGVMFEQNIPETMHLEVQVVRDRYGNTRHFGMRDCTEQRASQKIQEEAPPAVLRNDPQLEQRMCDIAVQIADRVGYVGACTVELMFKDGHFYLLEMNTRIQVEHPVTEEAHRIRVDGELTELNLVQLQFLVGRGAPIAFEQSAVENTRVAREYRINAEAFRPELKDSRDGGRGLFVPNAGIFDRIDLPEESEVLGALRTSGVTGVTAVGIRFDVGFEVGDTLVNKDPTFGKLIISVEVEPSHAERRYEALRLASLEVLRRTHIEGRQVMPDGRVMDGTVFENNISTHIYVLETECIRDHGLTTAAGRHVNWVIKALRADAQG